MKNNPANIISVTNERGITFNARLRNKGDNHGRNMKLVYEHNRPVIEFFDPRYKSQNIVAGIDLGFFVSSYFQDTIENIPDKQGLDLYGGEADWALSAANLLDIKRSFCQYITKT